MALALRFCQAIVCLPPVFTIPVMIVVPNSPVTGVVPATVCAALNSAAKSPSYRLYA